MARERTGMIFERPKGSRIWYARVTFVDQSGKRRFVKRRGDNKTHAKDLLRGLLRDIEDCGEKSLDGDRMTFADLADYYGSRYIVPAQYVEGRKIAGVRSLSSARAFLQSLRNYFNTRRIKSITRGDIQL